MENIGTEPVVESPIAEPVAEPVAEPIATAVVEAPVAEAPTTSDMPTYIPPATDVGVAAAEVVAKAGKTKGVCDIVFLIDATGSMQPAIDDLKKNVKLFFKQLADADANGGAIVKDWRARVIAYRDVKCDKEWYIDNPFVRNIADIEAQLNSFKADGGGDEPESLLDALYKVAKFGSTEKCAQEEDATKWRYRSDAARIVIVFTDASYHAVTSLSEAPNLNWEEIANLIMQEKIRLSIYAPQMRCYDDLSQIDKCEYMPIEFDPEVPNDAIYKLRDFTADTTNFQRTLQQLAKTVSTSAVAETL